MEYLKNNYSGEDDIMVVVKFNHKKSVHVMAHDIMVFNHVTQDDLLEKGYKEATAKEFDTFYNETIKKVDEVLNP